jgi:hypothetical protein
MDPITIAIMIACGYGGAKLEKIERIATENSKILQKIPQVCAPLGLFIGTGLDKALDKAQHVFASESELAKAKLQELQRKFRDAKNSAGTPEAEPDPEPSKA